MTRRKRSSENNEDPSTRMCKGQRKGGSDLKTERGKMKMVPRMISGEGSTEDTAKAVEGI